MFHTKVPSCYREVDGIEDEINVSSENLRDVQSAAGTAFKFRSVILNDWEEKLEVRSSHSIYCPVS